MGHPEKRCIDCKEDFQPRNGFEARCFSCWRRYQAEKWRRAGSPRKWCRGCRERFSPYEGWESYCRTCQREWSDQKLQEVHAQVQRLRAKKKAEKEAANKRCDTDQKNLFAEEVAVDTEPAASPTSELEYQLSPESPDEPN